MGWLKRITDWLSEQDWGVFNWIRDVLITLFDWLQDLAEEWLGWLIDLGKWIDDYFWRFYKLVVDWWDKLWKIICDYWDRFTRLVGDLWNGLVEWVDTWWDKIVDFFSYTLPNIFDSLKDIRGKLDKIFSGVWSDFYDFIQNIWPNFKEFVENKIKEFNNFITNLQKDLSEFQKSFASLRDQFSNFVSNVFDEFKKDVLNRLSNLSETVSNKILPSIDWLSEKLGKIPDRLIELITTPDEVKEEYPALETVMLEYTKQRTGGTSPYQIELPSDWRTRLRGSPEGWLEALLFFLLPGFIDNLQGFWKWWEYGSHLVEGRDELPDFKPMSLRELINGVGWVIGSLEAMILGAVREITVRMPDGSTLSLEEAGVSDPEMVAAVSGVPPWGPYYVFTYKPYAVYWIIHPAVDGWRIIYDPEKRAWRVERVSAEKCREVLLKAGVRFAGGGGGMT